MTLIYAIESTDTATLLREVLRRLESITTDTTDTIQTIIHFGVSAVDMNMTDLWAASESLKLDKAVYEPAFKIRLKLRRHKALLKLVKPQHEGNKARGPPVK